MSDILKQSSTLSNSGSLSPGKKASIAPSEFSKKSKFLCNFCGGKKCKLENYLNHPNPAIKGLNSDWITDRFLAMQRPSSRLIKEFDIIEQFKKCDIRAVFNLQEPGEHANCGDGNRKESGFSYLPEEFFTHGIFFYNFHWKDMTNTEFKHVLKIMSMIDLTYQQGGKIAVHCHAGKGRTAVVICSWLIFNGDYTALDAIKLFKGIRAGSLKKEKQKIFLERFEEYVKESRKSFYNAISIQNLLSKQSHVLFGEMKADAKHIPLVVYVILNHLQNDLELTKIDGNSIILSFFDLDNADCFKEKWSTIKDQIPKLKEKINLMKELEYIFTDLDVRLCVQILLDFLEQFEEPVISSKTVTMIYDFMTRESPDFVVIFQTDEINKNIEKHEFYLMNEIVKFAMKLFVNNSQMPLMKNFFLRVSLSLLNKTSEYKSFLQERSLILTKENADFLYKDEILKKLRQIFWLWFEEIRSSKSIENQIIEIEESFKSVSSPLLVKAKHMNINESEKRKRAKTMGVAKTKFSTMKVNESLDKEEEEKKD